MKRTIFSALMLFLCIVQARPTTNVQIQIVNLPTTFEGQQIAFAGNLNNWNTSNTVATVTNGILNYTLNDVTLTELTFEWIDKPTGANAGFRFVKSGSWEERIRAYFQTNDCNFRLTLTPDISNSVIIDALGESMPIVNQSKCVTVNGIKEDSNPVNKIDLTRFTFPNGKWKALIMSYDDSGTQDRDLVNIFNTYGIVGSFNLNSGFLGNSDKISASEVATLYANGNHEVALHTVSHPYLESLSDDDQYHQIADCQTTISNLVGYKVTGMAYPFGTYDKRVLQNLENLGIIYSRTTINTFALAIPNDLPSDLLRWNPTCHDSSADYYGTQLINWDKEEMALLYIWGHSWEHASSWTSLTAFCQKIGKRSDIWYAKAWEVAHYLTAVANVIKTGETSYYNPSTDTSVWIKTDDGIVELKPLKTLIISAIKDVNSKSFVLYPNPAKDVLNITSEINGKLTIDNYAGKPLLQKEIKEASTEISLNNIPKGTYLVQLENENELITSKMIKN